MNRRQKLIYGLLIIAILLILFRHHISSVVPTIDLVQSMKDNEEHEFHKWCSRADRVRKNEETYSSCGIQASQCSSDDQECTLVAVILVRIYENDTASWSRHHLDQWLRYMFYAGVNHVHLYDNFKSRDEKLRVWLREKYAETYVTYHDWSRPWYSYPEAQRHAYQDAVNRYSTGAKWHIAIDMDEYPLAPADIKCGFLIRAIKNLAEWDSAELSLKTFLLAGEAEQDEDWVAGRYRRRLRKTIMELDKPVYRPAFVRHASVHHNALLNGLSVDVDPQVLRINHYWGPRENWAENTPKLLKETFRDDSMNEIIKKLDRTVRCKNFTIIQ